MNELKEKYTKEIMKEMKKEFGYINDMQIPTLEKIIVNSGVSEATTNSSDIDKVEDDIRLIAGQKPLRRRAKKAISNFKIREGQEIGVMVTLRKERMWDFYQKLVSVVLPRVRDFKGVNTKLDGKGNYTLGITEHSIFPEIDTSQIDKLRGLQVVIVTTAKTDSEAKKLLELLGMPFKKSK